MNVLSTQMIAMIMQPVQILKNLTLVLAMIPIMAMDLIVTKVSIICYLLHPFYICCLPKSIL